MKSMNTERMEIARGPEAPRRHFMHINNKTASFREKNVQIVDCKIDDSDSSSPLPHQQPSPITDCSADGSVSNYGPRKLYTPKIGERGTIDRHYLTTDQYQKLHKRERALGAVSTQSHFSSLLRQAVKPCKQNDILGPRRMKYKLTSKPITPLPTTKLSFRDKPLTSLRMPNEGSSFYQYVRLNKSAHQRMINTNLYA